VAVWMSVLDYDDLRGALRPDAQGRRERGDLAALQLLLAETAQAPSPADPTNPATPSTPGTA
jgi:hypothetical protein